MLIDWFTVGAQFLNFLVLVWLLKRFLYKPILAAIDAREKRISDNLADAESRKKAAEQTGDELKKKLEEFAAARTEMTAKTLEEAKSQAQSLLGRARAEGDALHATQLAQIRDERRRFEAQIQQLAAGEVFELARKVLTDLAGANLESSIVGVFIGRLKTLDPKTRETVRAAFTGTSQSVVVRTRLALPDAARAALQDGINRALSADVRLSFIVQSDLPAGIEMTANGQRLAWSIEDYLDSLKEHLDDSWAAAVPAAQPVAQPAAQPAIEPAVPASAAA